MAKKAKEVTIESTEHLGNGLYKITYSDGSFVFAALVPQELIETIVSTAGGEESDEDEDEDDSDEDEDEVSIEDMKAALIESGVTKKDLKKMSDDEIEEAYGELESDDDEDEDESDDDEDESEDEEDDDDITPESLAEMDQEELEDLCDDKDLDTDPDDFDEEDVEKLRSAIAKELGIKLPKAAKKGKK